MWTQQLVKVAISRCFDNFNTRSLGLLILMSYEWCQKHTDLVKLTWDDLDFEEKKVKVGRVELYMGEPLHSLLKEQKELWDFQKYVLPYHRASDNAYRPLKYDYIKNNMKIITEDLGDKMNIQGVRELAIKEFLDGMVDPLYIMYVTGISKKSEFLKYMTQDADKAQAVQDKRAR